MDVLTPGGWQICLLPKCAKCKKTGKNPMEMDECPICNFDDEGDICVPKLCEEYVEEEMDDIEIMKTAIKTFGPQLQTVVAIEEMSELQKELTKFLRGNGKKKHLTEEVADALIMITQIQIIYGIGDEDVREVMDYKLNRLRERVQNV